jgi:hypothetical protein
MIQRSTRTTIPQFARLHEKLRQKSRFYYNWHLQAYASFVHSVVLIIAVIGISAGSFYILSKSTPTEAKNPSREVQARQQLISQGLASATSLVSKDTSGDYQTQAEETEVVDKRTETFKTFEKNDNGRQVFRIAGQIGPIHYKLDPFSATEQFKEIDLTLHQTESKKNNAPDYYMDQNGYQLKVWNQQKIKDADVNYIARFTRDGQNLSMAPMVLAWENAAGEYQEIAKPLAGITPEIDNNNYTITWKNAFGNGLDFRYNCSTDKFFKTVIVNDESDLPPATIGQDGLKLTIVMTTATSDVTAKNGFGKNNKNNQLASSYSPNATKDESAKNPTEFAYDNSQNQDLWYMQPPLAWDSADQPNTFSVSENLERVGSDNFMKLSASNTDLQKDTTKFPFYLDTTISDKQVGASTDDTYDYNTTWPGAGNTYLSSTMGYMGASTTYFDSDGNRFTNVPIAQGATINSANIILKPVNSSSTQTDLTIYGDAHDNAATFAATTNTATGSPGYRTLTTASAQWNIGTASWVSTSWYNSVNIASVIGEIVNRAGWVSNNSLAIIINNTSHTLPGSNGSRDQNAWDYSGNVSGMKFTATYSNTDKQVSISDSSTATQNSTQRKTWFDGTRYWQAVLNSQSIEFWYSTDGVNWIKNPNATLVDGGSTYTHYSNDFSIEADSNYAYISYSHPSMGTLYIRAATSYPGTGFGWGAENTVGSATGSLSTISRDSTGKVRVTYYRSTASLMGETKVDTPQGTKELKDLQIGDEVVSYDETLHMRTTDKVSDWQEHTVDEYLIIKSQSSEVKSSTDHIFYLADGQQLEAGELKVGMDLLQSAAGGRLVPEKILSIETVKGETKVYDITVKNNHNFFANNLLVHNFMAISSCSVKTKLSNAANDITAWGSEETFKSAGSGTCQGITQSIGSSNMYGVFTDYPTSNTNKGMKYTSGSGWGAVEAVDNIPAYSSNKLMSMVKDKSNNLHLVYVASDGTIAYRKYTTGWSGATTLEAGTTGTNPVITISANDNLCAFWMVGNTIYYKKYTLGAWDGSATSFYSTGTNTGLSAGVNSNASTVFVSWTNGSGAPYGVMWDKVTLPSGITVSGTVYTAENKSSNIGAGKTVALSINGAAAATVTSGAGGTFSFASVTVNANDTVSVYVSGDALKGSFITQEVDSSTNLSSLELYTGHIVLSHQTAGPMTNTLLATADNVADSDLLVSVDGSNNATFTAGNTLWILGGKTYTPGANVSAGSLNILSSGTFTPEGNTITLNDSGTPFTVGGTFNLATSTIVYAGASATNVTGMTYYNLQVNHTGTTFTAAGNMTANSVFTIAAGTFDASSRTITLPAAGTPLVKTGTLTPSTSTFSFTSYQNVTVAAADYYHLNLIDPPPDKETAPTENKILNEFAEKPVLISAINNYLQIPNSAIEGATTLAYKDSSGAFSPKPGEVELVNDRTENFKSFKEPGGQVRVAGQLGPIHYKDNPSDPAEIFKDIDLTINPVANQPREYAMDHNGYQANFWSERELNGQSEKYVARYLQNGKWLEMAPSELVYENDAGQHQLISKPQASGEPVVNNDDYTITWKDVFGKGIDYRYNVGTDKFFKTVIVNSKDALPPPTIDTKGLKLTVTLSLAWSQDARPNDASIRNIGATSLDSGTEFATAGSQSTNPSPFSFQDAKNQDLWWFQKPLGWDSSTKQNTSTLDWQIEGKDSLARMDISLPVSVLEDQKTTFPYYIDSLIIPEQQVSAANRNADYYKDAVYYDGAPNYTCSGSYASYYKAAGTISRFTPPIPGGYNILSANLTYRANSSLSATTVNTRIKGEHSSNSAVLSDQANFDARTLTTAVVAWDAIPAWTANNWYQSPDISSVVQEIVGIGGWTSGNGMLFAWNDWDERSTLSAYRQVDAYGFTGNTSGPKFNATYSTTPTYTLSAGTFNVGGNLTIGNSLDGMTVDADANDPIVNVDGNMSITANATYTASATAAFSVASNLTNAGVLTDSAGTLTLDGQGLQSITSGGTDGNHDYKNLTITNPDSVNGISFADSATVTGTFTDTTASSKATFHSGSTYAFNAININGQAVGTRITLTSSSGGSAWNFNITAASPTASYADVKDSNANKDITDTGGHDSTGNTHWLFPAAGITVSGTVYTAENQGSNIGAGKTIGLSINGATATTTTTTTGGAFSFSGITAAAGNTVAVYISGDTNKASYITIATDSSSNITGLALYTGHVVLSQQNGTAMSNSLLATANTIANSDMLISTSGGNTTFTTGNTVRILAAKNYTPGGNVTLDSLQLYGTFVPASNAINVSGNWDATGGTFTNTSSTITFNGTASGKTITSASLPFNSLTINGSGGVWTLQDGLSVASVLTITTGTLNGSSYTITLSGTGTPFVTGGTFTPSTSTVSYTGTTTATNVTSTTYYNLTLNNAATTFTAAGAITVSNVFTITTGTFNGSSYILTLSGSGTPFINSGTFNQSTSTIIYTGASATNVTGSTYYNLQVNHTGTTFTVAGSTTVNSVLTISAGTLDGSNQTIILAGSGTPFVNNGAFTPSTSTVKYTAAADTNIAAMNYNNLETSPSGDPSGGGSGWTATGAGDNSYNGTYSANGTFNGKTSYTNGSKWLFWAYEASLSNYRWCMSVSVVNPPDGRCMWDTAYYAYGGADLPSNWYVGTDTAPVPALSQSAASTNYSFASGTTNVNGNYVNGDGSHSVTTDLDTNDPVFNIDGNFSNSAGATFISSASASFSIASDFTNSATGTLTANGLITFDGQGLQTITARGTDGSHDFNNLTITNASTAGVSFADSATVASTFTNTTASSKVTFHSTSTYAFNTININGQATGTRVTLTSSSAGSAWNLNITAASPVASNVDVKDSNANKDVDATTGGHDSTGNTHWLFPFPGITVSGTVYTAENKSANIGSGKTIKLSVNGAAATSASSGSGGTFSFSGITIDTNNTVAVYVSGDTLKGSLITQAVDSTTSITGLELYTGHIILSHQTAGPMTDTLLATADNVSDSDLLESVSGSAATFTSGNTIWILGGKTYTPGGNVTAGSINILSTGTFSPEGNTVTLVDAGYPFTVSGTFNGGSSTVKFIGDGETTIAAITYNNLETSPAGDPTGDYSVTGAGMPEYNGVYTQNGTYGGFPTYYNGAKYICSLGPNDFRMGNQAPTMGVYSSASMVGTWGIGGLNGTPPAPTVSAVADYYAYSFAAGTVNINGNYTNGDGTHKANITADGNDPEININGNFTNSANATFTASATAAFSIASNYTNSGKFNNSGALLTLDGQGLQTVTTGGTDADHRFNDLSVTNASTAGVSFADSATVSGTFTDTTASSKLTFHALTTYAFAAININGQATGTKITMVSSDPANGTPANRQWYFNVSGASPQATFVNVTDSDASGGNAITPVTSTNGGNNENWLFNTAPVNNSLAFTNSYSGTTKTAVADDTTEWDYQAMVSDADGSADLSTVELHLANLADSAQPYDSLKFRWTRSSDTFSEVADTQNAATITSTASESNAVGNQWTLDFKIKFNSSFTATDTDYAAELVSTDSAAATDTDNYTALFRVTPLSISMTVDSPTLSFGNLLPGNVLTGTTVVTVTTNFANGYSLSASDSVAGGDSTLLHQVDLVTRIADYLGTIGTPTLWSGTGLGISLYSATGKEAKWGSGTTESDLNNKYAGVPLNATVVHAKTGSPTTNDANSVGYKLVVPTTQKTGAYSGDITYTVTGTLQ